MTTPEPSSRPVPDPDPIRAARAEAEALDVIPVDASTAGEQAGDQIGRYELLQQIGEGGFGTVWMAEQREPVKRQVALKIIKLGMDTKQVIARFEAERQALALMDHPNIAKVFDADATEVGRPFFVMELVEGVSILEYCDTEKLDTEQRLTLFTKVCQAIQHAHQKGIIHRDIKPSNVLVTLHDGVPGPKVIDFGIAKAINQELTEKTLFTEYRQIIGTPEYMSPEQAEISELDIDTRADVYALGVLLYELLTGTTPFDVRMLLESGYEEMLRAIREDEPHKPSTRISTMGDTAAPTAERRHTNVHKLGVLLRGDLDWIVMKCLEKDRGRRYETASGLAEDIRRHLEHEPVVAGPRARSYRLRKFVRRNRRTVGAVAAVFGVLLLGMAGTGWGLLDAISAREAESVAREQAEMVGTFTSEMLSAINPETAREMDTELMRLVLDGASHRIEGAQAMDPMVEADIRATIGLTYRAIGEHDKAQPHLERAREIRRRALGEDDPDTLESMNTVASLYWDQGRYADAEALFLETVEAVRGILGPEHPDTLQTVSNLANAYRKQERYEEAESLLVETLEIQRRVCDARDKALVQSINLLGDVYAKQGRYDEAEPLLAEALATTRKFAGEEHPDTLQAKNDLANLYALQGRLADAEPLFLEALEGERRVLGSEHPKTLMPMGNLAILYLNQRRYEKAEVLFVEELEIARRILGPEHPDTLRSSKNLAILHSELGRYAVAEPLALAALEGYRRVLGDDSPRTVDCAYFVGVLYSYQGRYEEAEPYYREALEGRRLALGPDHPATLESMSRLADLYATQGRFDDARPLVESLIGLSLEAARAEGASAIEKNKGAWMLLTCEPADLRDPETALTLALDASDQTGQEDPAILDTLALAYHLTGDTPKAIEIERRAISLLPPGESPMRAALEPTLARFEAALEAPDDAE